MPDKRTPRDPKINPVAGDRVRIGGVTVLVLPCAVDGVVFYEKRGKPFQMDLPGWREWCSAREAKVL